MVPHNNEIQFLQNHHFYICKAQNIKSSDYMEKYQVTLYDPDCFEKSYDG